MKLLIVVLFLTMVFGGVAMAKEKDKIAVIVVDVQADFTKFKQGALAVEGTDESYIKTVEENTKRLKEKGFPVFATQDWHPANHASFFTQHKGKKAFDIVKLHGKNQVLWPPHCVQKKPGSDLLSDKKLFTAVVKKGMDPQYDSYSGFHDDGGKKTEMAELLKKNNIGKLIIYGIATDYCVKATAMDAVAEGFKVALLKDLCRGVAPDTSKKALEEMKARGIMILEGVELEKIESF
jgi:nicotinamidase/pyrazinamidase